MSRPCLPPDLPEQINDEEKRELERGVELLSAMMEIVRMARPAVQDVSGEGVDDGD